MVSTNYLLRERGSDRSSRVQPKKPCLPILLVKKRPARADQGRIIMSFKYVEKLELSLSQQTWDESNFNSLDCWTPGLSWPYLANNYSGTRLKRGADGVVT